ncbi:AAA family ATPase [Owenweeksia hongkongensis]|uniref:AAA family ATPase n=1 Tax=Owenweeksia hongkongensis TaxID=253245 RepID=UPI003A8D8702
MSTTKRVIITGGPGTGKSTIIDLMKQNGYTCHTEVSRSVIKKELAKGSAQLPWDDLSGFSNLVFDGQTNQYRNAAEGKINFYDRGIIDVIAYLKKDNLPADALEDLAIHYPYHTKVFLTPPWEEIYSMDEERREDFATMNTIHEELIKAYTSFGYEVVEVPKSSSQERVKFILAHLGVE